MNIIHKVKEEFLSDKFIKFFIVGVVALGVDTLVLTILQFELFKEEQTKVLGVVYGSKLISSVVGITVSFLMNRYWSFSAQDDVIAGQAFRMTLSFIATILMSSLFYSLYFDFFEWQNIINLNGETFAAIANAGTAATTMVINFFVYKYFVFKK